MAKSPLLVLTPLAVCSLPLGGCVPGTHVDASPVAGQVVDRTTRRPIAGAKVVLSTFSPDHEAQTHTDQEGRFHLAGFRHLDFTPSPYRFYRVPPATCTWRPPATGRTAAVSFTTRTANILATSTVREAASAPCSTFRCR